MTRSSSSGPTTFRSLRSSGPGRIPYSRPAGSPAPPRHWEPATSSTSGSGAVRSTAAGLRAGPSTRYESQFRDIVPEQRIVYTYEMYADEDRISVSVATVEFRGHGATTQLVLTEQGVFLDGHDTAAQREEGTRSLLDSLAATWTRRTVSFAWTTTRRNNR